MKNTNNDGATWNEGESGNLRLSSRTQKIKRRSSSYPRQGNGNDTNAMKKVIKMWVLQVRKEEANCSKVTELGHTGK